MNRQNAAPHQGLYLLFHYIIRESPPQFENRIMARVYVRSITRSTMYQKSSTLLAGTGVWKISSVACGFSSIKIDYSDYPKNLISRINEVEKPKLHLSRWFCCNHTCYCVHMVSVTSVSRYITSSSRYHPRYQSRSSMYIRGLILRNFVELAEAVPIVTSSAFSLY